MSGSVWCWALPRLIVDCRRTGVEAFWKSFFVFIFKCTELYNQDKTLWNAITWSSEKDK